MAERPINNFKTAMNELMGGKIRTNVEPPSEVNSVPTKEVIKGIPRNTAPIFKMGTPTTTPSSQPSISSDENAPNIPSEASTTGIPSETSTTGIPSEASTTGIPSETSTPDTQNAIAAQDEGVSSAPSAGLSNSPSIFSSDIIIEGPVKSKSDIRLNGYIKGDVSCGGTVISTGTIDGNIEGADITLIGSTVTGSINARNSISMDSNSAVTGDIVGTTLNSDGKIKGNILLKESIELKANATVFGNIKAKNISIEAGATLVGHVETKSVGMRAAAPSDDLPAYVTFTELLAEKKGKQKYERER